MRLAAPIFMHGHLPPPGKPAYQIPGIDMKDLNTNNRTTFKPHNGVCPSVV